MEENDEDKAACDDVEEPENTRVASGVSEDRRYLAALTAYDTLRSQMARVRAELGLAADPQKFPHGARTPNEPLMRPDGDAAILLEHQIATCAALMGYIAHFVARPDTDPGTCISFMNSMSSMIGANAQLGKVVGRLRGNFSETHQTITVNKVITGERVGEGVLES